MFFNVFMIMNPNPDAVEKVSVALPDQSSGDANASIQGGERAEEAHPIRQAERAGTHIDNRISTTNRTEQPADFDDTQNVSI